MGASRPSVVDQPGAGRRALWAGPAVREALAGRDPVAAFVGLGRVGRCDGVGAHKQRRLLSAVCMQAVDALGSRHAGALVVVAKVDHEVVRDLAFQHRAGQRAAHAGRVGLGQVPWVDGLIGRRGPVG